MDVGSKSAPHLGLHRLCVFFFAMCTEFHLELELGLWQIVPFFGGAGKYGPGHADQQPRRPGTWRAQPI